MVTDWMLVLCAFVCALLAGENLRHFPCSKNIAAFCYCALLSLLLFAAVFFR